MKGLRWLIVAAACLAAPAVASGQIVVSQVYAGGGSYSSTYTHDFVELFNRGTTSVNVTGWTVSFKQYNFESWSDTPLFGMIPPGGYFLVRLDGSTYSGTYPLPAADATGYTDLASSGTVVLFDYVGNPADYIGYGIGPPYYEGTQLLSTLGYANAALRYGNGCVDTDNNGLDFRSAAPVPYNSSHALQPCAVSKDPEIGAMVDPVSARAGSTVLFSALVIPGQNPASTGFAVAADLTAIGGPDLAYFFDDGTHGDSVAGDLIFCLSTQIAPGTQLGPKSIPVAVADDLQRSSLTYVDLAVVATGPPASDVDGDGKSDIVWRHSPRGEVWTWLTNGAWPTPPVEAYVRTVGDTNWEIRSVADLTGDGKADILWRHKTGGDIYLWHMNGAALVEEVYVSTVNAEYDVVGTGDLNGDGKSDVLWRHKTRGDVWIWLMDGGLPTSEVYIDTVSPSYAVKGLGDLDGDGKADIVWRGAAGDVWVWPMNGTTRLDQVWVGTVPDAGYQIQAVADFGGGGKASILWWHATRGEVWLWTMNGAMREAETWVGTVPDTTYQIAATGDYDGGGKADLLWRNVVNGEVWVWLMNGPVRASETWVATVPDTGYRIIR